METKNEKPRIFDIQIASALLKLVIKLLCLVSESARLSIKPDGIILSSVDDAQISRATIQIEKSLFEKYNATEFTVGLDLNWLKKIMSQSKVGDILQISFDSRQNQMIIEMGDIKIRNGLIDIADIFDTEVHILDSTGHIELIIDELKRGLIIADEISEEVHLDIDNERFQIKAEGMSKSVKLVMFKKDAITIQSDIPHRNLFYCNRLSKIISELDSEKSMKLRFGNDSTPLKLSYNIIDAGCRFTYFLIPLIESIDDYFDD